MVKLFKNSLVFLLTATLLSSVVFVNTAHAETLEKVYCQATIDDDFTDNEILIITMPFANYKEYIPEDFANINCIGIEELSCNIKEDDLCRTIELTIEGHSKQNVLEAIDILESRNDIYCAQPNYIYQNTILDSQIPDMANNVNISPSSIANQSWISLIELNNAWDTVLENNSNNDIIRIGVVDGVIDTDHTYLREYFNTELTTEIISITGGNGNGHGTKVAGVIVSTLGAFNGEFNDCTNDIELVSLVTQYAGTTSGNSSCYATAINLAGSEQYDIDILNMSLDAGNDYDEAIKCAILNYDGLIVCAAGNRNIDLDNAPEEDQVYPAYYNYYSNVISVGASSTTTNSYDQTVEIKYPTSNYGYIGVDIFAPGNSIQTTAPNNLFDTISETSSAAPIVTGVAALMLKTNPNLKPDEIKVILNEIGNDDSSSWICYSKGRINAYQAVTHALSTDHINRNSNYDGVEDIDCSTCGYTTLTHNYVYSRLIGNIDVHRVQCLRCGDYYYEGHDWVRILDTFQCTKCNIVVSDGNVPEIMTTPPPANDLNGDPDETE